MSLTTIVSNVFKPRQKELEKYVNDAEHLQHHTLMRLIEKGKNTEYGVKHLLNTTNSYEKFAMNVPVNTYEELKGGHRPHAPWRKGYPVAGYREMVC